MVKSVRQADRFLLVPEVILWGGGKSFSILRGILSALAEVNILLQGEETGSSDISLFHLCNTA